MKATTKMIRRTTPPATPPMMAHVRLLMPDEPLSEELESDEVESSDKPASVSRLTAWSTDIVKFRNGTAKTKRTFVRKESKRGSRNRKQC